MATLIRSARMADNPVTLTAGREPQAPHIPQAHRNPLTPALPAAPSQDIDSQLQRLEKDRQAMLQQIEDERDKARDAGYADGYAEGEKRGTAEFENRLKALGELTGSLAAELDGGLNALEEVVVGIAFEAVCKILGAAMMEPAGVLAAVREAISRVREQESILLHVSPADHKLLQQHWDALVAEYPSGRLELVADDRVQVGGCLIETAGGTLDGRLDSQLQQLRDTLLAARKLLPE